MTPLYNAETPSSRMIVYTACAALRYRGISSGSTNECCCACNLILTTSIGQTTAIASVVPAPRPAGSTNMRPSPPPTTSQRTDEDISNARLPCGLVRQPSLVRLEAGETDGHLGNDARQDRTEPLVQRKRSLALHDTDGRRDDAARFRLPNGASFSLSSGARRWHESRTPAAVLALESCIRTLMVSSGWQHSWRGQRRRREHQPDRRPWRSRGDVPLPWRLRCHQR